MRVSSGSSSSSSSSNNNTSNNNINNNPNNTNTNSVKISNRHGAVTATATDKIVKGKKSNLPTSNVIAVKSSNNNNTSSGVKKVKGKELLK